MGIKLNFNDLPEEQKFEEIKEGIYILQVDDIIEEVDDYNQPKLVMSHTVVGMNRKVTFDNYRLNNETGEINTFGRRKLRKFIEATNVDLEEITTVALQKIALGRLFKAELENNDKGYPRIKFDNMYPLDSSHEALNEDLKEKAQEARKESALPDIEDASEAVKETFDPEDI